MPETAEQIAQKWANAMAASTQKFTAGVEAVSTNPMEKAAARADQYLAGVQEAVASGRYSAGLRRVSLSDWKQAMIKKGAPRLGSGAQAAIPKFRAFMTRLMSHIESGKSMLESTPRGDFATNVQRAVRWMEHMHQAKGQLSD